MPTITIEVNDQELTTLSELAKRCSEIDVERDGATSHGELTVDALLAMLAEDAAMVITRPGCWEAANMATVLTAHGYEI